MKKTITMLLAACTLLSCASFACAAELPEENPSPVKLIAGTWYPDLASLDAAEAEAEAEAEEAATASDSEENSCPVKLISGTWYPNMEALDAAEPIESDESSNVGITPMAATRPTSLAPASFYDTKQYWTATNYTWTSYMFTQAKGYFFDCRAKQKFAIEMFEKNGTSIGIISPEYQSNAGGFYWLEFQREYMPNPYYVKIINRSGTPIRDKAIYSVYSAGDTGLPAPWVSPGF